MRLISETSKTLLLVPLILTDVVSDFFFKSTRGQDCPELKTLKPKACSVCLISND